MTKSKVCTGIRATVFLAAMSVLGAGCADISPSTIVSPSTGGSQTAAVPRVEDCGIVGISSPSKFACGGKVYTSFQLAKLRENEIKKYDSGLATKAPGDEIGKK